MRIRRNACFWSAPPAYSGRGRPQKHGQKMKLNDPETWPETTETIKIDHPQLGTARSLILEKGKELSLTGLEM
jgi:hypothetical protein